MCKDSTGQSCVWRAETPAGLFIGLAAANRVLANKSISSASLGFAEASGLKRENLLWLSNRILLVLTGDEMALLVKPLS